MTDAIRKFIVSQCGPGPYRGTAETKHYLLVTYMATPEGRRKILEARYGPAYTRYQFLKTKFRSRPEEYKHPWTRSEFHLTDELLLACIPEDERNSPEYGKLADLIEQARRLYVGDDPHDYRIDALLRSANGPGRDPVGSL